MSVYGQLNAAKLALLKTELQTDPRSLGCAGLLTVSDWVSLALLMNFIRDGATACPLLNNVAATNVIGGPSGAITAVTNVATAQITSAAHGLSTGDSVVIVGVVGATGVNGTWQITKVDANNFTVPNAAAPGAYTSGGTWTWCVSGVRNTSVKTQDIIGATKVADIDATVSAQETAIWSALMNDGAILLTNPDGSENNNGALVKKMWTANSASRTAITALESRLGGRGEQVLSLAGTGVGSQQVNGLPFNFSNLLDQFDCAAAIAGHY